MSRLASHSLSRVAAALVFGLALAACHDAVDAPRNVAFTPPSALQEREVTLFVGDTLDMSGVLDLAASGGRGACTSDNAAVAAIDGGVFLVGAAAGDVV